MNFGNLNNLNGGAGAGNSFNVGRYNAQDVLNEIHNMISHVIMTNAPGDLIISALDRMEVEKKIKIIGIGTNRLCIKIVADMRDVLNRIGYPDSNVSTVIKIPYNLSTGGKDNLREAFAFEYTRRIVTGKQIGRAHV